VTARVQSFRGCWGSVLSVGDVPFAMAAEKRGGTNDFGGGPPSEGVTNRGSRKPEP